MRAYAKLNLTLDVLNKRKDNFHNINSIMQQVNLYDELLFEKSKKIIVKSQFKDDLVKKAAEKLKELFCIEQGIKITVKKNIPTGAGLGGGSADAALTLLVLNKLWDINLHLRDLKDIALELGTDIPFFLEANCALISGKGDKIEKLNGKEYLIVLINSGYELSSKDAYKKLSKTKYKKTKSTLKFRKTKNLKHLHNDFINIQSQDVLEIIEELKQLKATAASITGKGPTVFGIFKNIKEAKKAYNKFKDKYAFVKLTKTLK